MASKRVIEKFVAEISADDTQFKKQLQSSARDAQAWGGDIKRQFATAAKVGAGLLTAAAGAAALTFNETRKVVDEQAKYADSIGITTEALAGLEQAAAINGATTEGMRKGLERLVVNVNDFRNGIGDAVPAFERLNIKVDDLKNKSPDEMFAMVGDRLKTIPDQAERAALAYDIFGRQGIKLIKTLELGTEGIAQFKEEANRLGLSLSRVDAAQVEAANDAITRAQSVAKGFANRLTVELAPAVETVATMYTEAALNANGFADTAGMVGDIAEAAIGGIGDTWEEISLGIIESRAQLARFAAFSLEVFQQLNVFGLSDKLLGVSAEDVTQSIKIWREIGEDNAAAYEIGLASREQNGSFSERFAKQLAENKKKLEEELGKNKKKEGGGGGGGDVNDEVAKAMESSVKQIQSAIAAAEPPLKQYAEQVKVIDSLLAAGKLSQDEYNKALSIYKQKLDDATGVNDQWKKDLSDAAKFAESAKTEIDNLNDELARARELAKDGLISPDVLAKTEERLAKSIEEVKNAGDKMSVFAEQAARNIQDQFGQTIEDTLTGNFDGILASWGDMLAKMGSQAIAAQLSDAFNLEDLLKGGGGGSGGSLLSSAKSFFGGFFADGGYPDPNKISIVGERGPELFVPKGVRGEVIPNHKMTSAQLGGSPTYIINVTANDQRGGQVAGGAIRREINRTVADAQRYR